MISFISFASFILSYSNLFTDLKHSEDQVHGIV